jgi:hypothetical protein
MATVETRVEFLAAVPQFTVADVVRTAEYYRDVLGFDIAGYWDGERVHRTPHTTAVFGIVSRGAVQIFFNRATGSGGVMNRADDAYDAYVRVAGIDALGSELRRRGADILDGPDDRVYGQRELIVRDCNGRVLAFGEPISRRSA